MKKTILKSMPFVIVIMMLLGASATHANNQHDHLTQQIENALTTYSTAMGVQLYQKDDLLSDQIHNLIVERKLFYERYFQTGLHSKLLNISTDFEPTKAIELSENTYQVQEIVTLTGKPILQVAEDYPVYKAYLLAATMAKDTDISHYLEQTAAEIRGAVQESIDANTFEITIINLHKVTFNPQTGQLVSDSFTSEANDDPGTDKVEWVDGKAKRVEPDFTHLPDYEIYSISEEVLAQQILEDLNAAPSESSNSSYNTLVYSGSTAAYYARSYVRATQTYAWCGRLRDMTVWNPIYYYPPSADCLDCVNFVSQAIHAGGISTDSTWYPWTATWVNVTLFQNYVLSRDLGYRVSNCYTLGLGDIGIQPATHVAIVTALNPLRYSGHTNDRLNYPWQSVLSTCVNLY